MCNKFKMPTGQTGATNDFILCSQIQIMQQIILMKFESGGGDFDRDDFNSKDDGDENMEWLHGEDDDENKKGEDVEVPALPPIDDNEDSEKNDEEDVGNEEVGEESRCGGSVDNAREGSIYCISDIPSS